MTAPETVDPVREWRELLPTNVRRQLHDTARATVLVARSIRVHGWTPATLAAECMRQHNGAVNPAGIVMHRLEWCADNPPVQPSGARRVPFCSPECRDNAGWILDPETLLPARPCNCRKANA
jgi:hypothetical protein